MTFLYSLPPLMKGNVIQRPSASCRSPYVADVLLTETNETIIAHAPSLGCCGYADKDQYVYVTKKETSKLCTHVIHLALREEKNQTYLIGIHPKSAEHIVHLCLQKGCIHSLTQLTHIEREKCFLNSRFDFVARDKEDKTLIIEVKNVPCAHYEDMDKKELKRLDFSERKVTSKVGYFPDGYRKIKSDPVSPRALKHIQELVTLKQQNPDYRCVLLFVIQRHDVAYFQASVVDPLYRQALHKAFKNGVEVIPIQVEWNEQGECRYVKTIPFMFS